MITRRDAVTEGCKLNAKKIIMALIVLTLLSCSQFSMAKASTPPIPPAYPPSPMPVPQSPSGGYSPPSEPVTFQSYSLPLLSSDGTVTGNITGIDFNTVRLLAMSSVSSGDGNYSLIISEDLSQKPGNPMMDIIIGNDGNLPGGMDSATPLVSVSVTRQSLYGWSVKAGTLTMTFSVPLSRLNGSSADATYYLIRYDGAGYQLVKADLIDVSSSATFQASPPDDSGTFTLAMVRPSPVLPGPALLPSQLPMVAIAPAQTPVSSVVDYAGDHLALIVVLINGVAIGCIATLIIRFR